MHIWASVADIWQKPSGKSRRAGAIKMPWLESRKRQSLWCSSVVVVVETRCPTRSLNTSSDGFVKRKLVPLKPNRWFSVRFGICLRWGSSVSAAIASVVIWWIVSSNTENCHHNYRDQRRIRGLERYISMEHSQFPISLPLQLVVRLVPYPSKFSRLLSRHPSARLFVLTLRATMTE